MPRLTQEQAQQVIEDNIYMIYHMPARYENINHYLKGNVRKTLLQLYRYMQDKEIIIDKHRYLFVLDNTRLTQQVRKKAYANDKATSFRYMSILCAMGLLTKIPQSKADPDNLLQVNRNYFTTYPDRQKALTVYTFRRYTEKELDRIEARSERLKKAGVRIGNVSFNMLMVNNCQDIAFELFRSNNRTAPERKKDEYEYLLLCIDMLIESKCYAHRQEIIDNLSGFGMSVWEIDKLFKIFRNDLMKRYYFKRPTKDQKAMYGLQDDKFIYTPREETTECQEVNAQEDGL